MMSKVDRNDVSRAAAANSRATINELIAAGCRGEALAAAREHWAEGAASSSSRYIQSLLTQLWPQDQIVTHKVAFLRSYTIEPLLPLLEATAALDGCRIEAWVGQFNAYAQEILDDGSGLYAFRPDTIILAVQSRDICPALWRDFADLGAEAVGELIQSVSAHITNLLSTLRKRCVASIVVHGLEAPVHPANGLYDSQQSAGQVAAFDEINRLVRGWIASTNAVYWLDYERLQSLHGRLRWHDEKKWAAIRLPLAVDSLAPMAATWWRILTPIACRQAKVLVVDLDNTLWGGILGEDGLDGILVGDELPGMHFLALQRVILDLAKRGVILAIRSKNNESEALQALASHPGMLLRPESFSAMRINWCPKSEGIAEIAAELNVGIDAIAFLDDNPVERDAVRRMLPNVRVIDLPDDPALYASTLRKFTGFERLALSGEDVQRSRYYLDERHRRESEANIGSLEDFLQSLRIEVQAAPVNKATLARAAQLTQKTNQLNVTTKRYTEAELESLMAEPGYSAYTLTARDRFGDNGIVGVAILNLAKKEAEIDTFLLSCRVIGRGIESAFLALLAEASVASGCVSMAGWFLPTAKNVPASTLYSDNGFLCVSQGPGDASRWVTDLTIGPVVVPGWIFAAQLSTT
jgi:FkbH-like protein